MADNKIRVKQIEQTDLSGYIGGVFAGTTSGKATDLNPASSGAHDLGSADKPWKTVYAESISVSGIDGAANSIYPATGNLLPIQSGVHDLGSPTRPWNDLYLNWDSIYMGNVKLSMGTDGVIRTTKPGEGAVKMAIGPTGERGGFGGDSTLYYYDHQTGSVQTYPNSGTRSTGYFTVNSTGNFDTVTKFYIQDSGYYNQTGKYDLVNNEPWLSLLSNSTSDTKGTLRVFNHDNPSNFASFNVAGGVVNQSGYYEVPVSFINSSETNHLITGAFKEDEKVVLSFSPRGDKGLIGPQGPSNGPQGPQGNVGTVGPQGGVGPQGPGVGETGPTGESIYWSGIWNPIIPYSGNTIVSRGTNSFINVWTGAANLGHTPTGTADDKYWDLVVSGLSGPQGPQGIEGGPPGLTGATGAQGPQGAQGQAGPIGQISGSTNAVKKTIQQTDFWVGENAFGIIDAVRFNGTEYVKSRANSEQNSEVMGVVESLDTGNNSFTIVTEGHVSWATGSIANSPFAEKTTPAQFVPGTVYWLDDSTAGLLTSGEPNTVGSVSKPLFHATSISGGFIQNHRGQVIDSGIGPNFIVPGIGNVTLDGQQTLTSKTIGRETKYGVKLLNWNNGNVTIDFDEEPFQTLEILGDTRIRFTNGGVGKTITLRLKGGGFDFDLTWGDVDDKPIFIGSLEPTRLKAGKYALVSLTSFGATHSDTMIAFGDQK
tara:strand:- start:6603 stop:8726 length:2124 start_codon:yes stop_codon:yes gene_type:complete